MTQRDSLAPVFVTIIAAFALWYFSFQTDIGNFWLRLSLSAALLAGGALLLTPARTALFKLKLRDVLIGIISAILLYGIFWAGKYVSTAILPFAAGQINDVYMSKAQLDPLFIGLLLFFLLGPSEELFWRGFVQRRLSERFGSAAGLLATTAAYALVHLWTLNFMLIIAASIAGLFWGWLYWRARSLVAVMLSHGLWDLIIFVLLPLI